MSGAQAPSLRWTPVWIVALVAAWPLPVVAQALLSVGALVGLCWLLWRRSRGGGAVLSGPAWALTGVLFCAYWLPEVIAAVDAETARSAWRWVALDLRLLPLLCLAAVAVADDARRRWLFAVLAALALAWTVDGLLAVAVGHSLLQGLYANAGRLLAGLATLMPGVATDASHGIGALGSPGHWLTLACLSSFALDWAARRSMVAWWVAALVFVAGIALSNAPSAWIAFACVLVLELVRRFDRRRLLGVLVVVGFGVGLAWSNMSRAPEGDTATVVQDLAEATAASWRESRCLMRTHPINGVGVGAMVSGSSDCAPDSGSDAGSNGLRLLLELPAETGLIGVLLWLAGAALAWRAWRYADTGARMRAWPALQALAAMLVPFNASPPVYAGVWGSAVLLMAGLYAGALWGRLDPEPAPQS